jgi:hypothetical protein
MRIFFRTKDEIEVFLDHLFSVICPFCGAVGTVIRHGFVRWFRSPKDSGIRAWRVRCKKSAQRNGCGKTWSIRTGDTLARRSFSAQHLWSFLAELQQARSIRSAWIAAKFPLTLDSAYRIYRHLHHCQSVLRTHLCARAPPPQGKRTGVPLFQVFQHLKEAFGPATCRISAYQENFQRSFLATA